MREIKFRGKTLSDDHEWLYGNLNLNDDGKSAIMRIGDFWSLQPVNPDTVGQFTGLKDSTGKEIYEGDIVRFELPPMVLTNEKTAVGAVVFEYGQFLVIIQAMRFTIFSVIKDCTVIGNIHDNQELLRLTKTGGFEK